MFLFLFKKLMNFFKQKWVRRAAWTILNSLSAIMVACVIYVLYPEQFVMLIVVPVGTAASQLLTKWINQPTQTPEA